MTEPKDRRRGTLPAQAVAVLVAIALAALLLAGLIAASSALAAGSWSWPVEGDVITRYRNGTDPYAAGRHRGIDIAAHDGTTVRAATAGTVSFAGPVGSSGLVVSVRTADGRHDTSYLHLGALGVEAGEPVDAGAALGSVGTSGTRSAAAPHLHFGVRAAGEPHAYRDPLRFLGRPLDAPQPPPLTPPRSRASPAPAHRAQAAPTQAAQDAPAIAPVPDPIPAPGLRRRPQPGRGQAAAGAPLATAPDPGREAPQKQPGGASVPGGALAGLGIALALAALGVPRLRRRTRGFRRARRHDPQVASSACRTT